jgi:RNA polymerase sigma factor for flagellar operon FliA
MKRLEVSIDRGLDESTKEEIIKSLLPYIKYTAQRLSWNLPPQLTVDDLISAGIAGLLEALDRYREELGEIEAFVRMRIKGAMIDELRANSTFTRGLRDKLANIRETEKRLEVKLGRLPEAEEIAEDLHIPIEEYYQILSDIASSILLRFEDFSDSRYDDDLSLQESIPDGSAKTPDTIYEEKKLRERIASVIEKLPEKERLVISLYYWDELTMKEIAKVLGITEGRVSQLHAQAIVRLRACLGGWDGEHNG